MRTPYHGKFDPFELHANVMFFHDWRYVYHGYPRWETPEGEAKGLWGPEPIPQLYAAESDRPWGIRLRAQPAQKSEPFLSCEADWEGFIGAPTVLCEDGRYRLWYEVTPTSHMDSGEAGVQNLLAYAESDDGMTWTRPKLGLVEFEGHKDNNIVYGGHLTPGVGYHGGSIFRDPTAPPQERYKAWHLGMVPEEMSAQFQADHPGRVDPMSVEHKAHHGMFGAVSPDGLRWRPLPECLVMQTSDTQNICYYDELLGKYVAYFRTWMLGRRSIGRAETDDFRSFPLPETFMWPGADVGPSDLWYGNGKQLYPGTLDYHLLFCWRWNVADDRFFTHMAVSPDGMVWSRPPEDQVITPGTMGQWDAGGVISGRGMVELPGERVGVICLGYRVPHKHARRRPLGELGWAWWPKGRLVALEAPERGEFRTFRVLPKGNELHLNVRTRHAGAVRIEVLGGDREPVQGRTFAECDPVSGDFLDHTVTWRGESLIPRKDDEPIAFRVRLASAQLFAMSFA